MQAFPRGGMTSLLKSVDGRDVSIRAAAGARRLSPAELIYGTAMPLLRRFQATEGGLLLVNLVAIGLSRPGLLPGLSRALVSSVVLATLYGVNDFIDARGDLLNAKKDQRLSRLLLAQREAFSAILLAQSALAVSLAWALIGPAAAWAVLWVFAVNAAYSLWLKGWPGVDVFWAGLWGASYAAIAVTNWRFCLLIGLLISISHVYQTMVDGEIDRLNGLRTTGTFSRGFALAAMSVASAALALFLWSEGHGPLTALSALIPLSLGLLFERRHVSWLLSKAYFVGLIVLAFWDYHAPR